MWYFRFHLSLTTKQEISSIRCTLSRKKCHYPRTQKVLAGISTWRKSSQVLTGPIELTHKLQPSLPQQCGIQKEKKKTTKLVSTFENIKWIIFSFILLTECLLIKVHISTLVRLGFKSKTDLRKRPTSNIVYFLTKIKSWALCFASIFPVSLSTGFEGTFSRQFKVRKWPSITLFLTKW